MKISACSPLEVYVEYPRGWLPCHFSRPSLTCFSQHVGIPSRLGVCKITMASVHNVTKECVSLNRTTTFRCRRGLTLKLVNRERSGAWKKLHNTNIKQDKAFTNYPRRMCVRLHDIVRVIQHTYYLGFSRCGSYIVSYTTHCRRRRDNAIGSAWNSGQNAHQTCMLTLWEYLGRRPLIPRHV